MRSKEPGGYAGLIMLLIVVAIIAFLVWRPDIFSGGAKGAAGATSTSTVPTVGNNGLSPIPTPTTVEGDVNAIQQAKNAQQQLENQHNQEVQGI